MFCRHAGEGGCVVILNYGSPLIFSPFVIPVEAGIHGDYN
ncbi:hypothetical protein D3OALGA1CA_244 [Olavius algarvensis associated proteobacterium Delta 3]|nr:hypothetical protein D3OALGA1CA_244 [Olavius algarvensis associated proteobacterium Delta 3]CAB5098782.1 hypothetical protein D3OALGB2SA_1700 [Olavius algarvensis associated proteobacterium Delta 3]